jgi:tetratricopeptide (TPR) repeat protein
MEDPGELDKAVSALPGAMLLRDPVGSKAFMQTVRHIFRTKARFKTVSRLIAVSRDEIDRTVAADSLGYFGKRGTPFLIRALESDDAPVRRHAAFALGLTGDTAAEPALRSALKDPDPKVRFSAAQSLDLIAILSQVSAPALVDLEEFRKDLEPEIQNGNEHKPSVILDLETRNLFEELGRLGDEKLRDGKFEEAAQHFGEMIGLAAGVARPYLGRGTARERQGRYAEALGDLNRAIELDAETGDAYGRRALCHRRLGDWDSALSDARKAAELEPENAQNWYNVGFLEQSKENHDSAMKAYDRAIELRPDYAVARQARGTFKLSQGDAAGAIEDISVAIQYNPTAAAAWWNRGIAHGMSGNVEAQESDIRRALELSPEMAAQLGGKAP